MAQDYHIYIHSKSDGSSGSKTQPFSAKSDGDSSFKTSASQAYKAGQTIASGQTVSTGVAALSKAVPAIAIAIAAIKITDRILETGFSHVKDYTGIYKYSVGYSNFKTVMTSILNPLGYIKSVLHETAQRNKINKEIVQQNNLLGDTVMENFGLGV